MTARSLQPNMRQYCVQKRAKRFVLPHPVIGFPGLRSQNVSLLLSSLLILPLSTTLSVGAWAQPRPVDSSSPRLTESGGPVGVGENILGILGLGNAPRPTSNTPGLPCSETLRGNGTGVGYTLSHGNILPETLSVHAGGASLHLNRDYWVDADSGALYFANPIKSFDSIRVFYRYLAGADAPHLNSVLPGLQLRFGNALNLGLAYGTLAGDSAGTSTSLYGLGMNSQFGAGKQSRYSGLVYFSKSQLNASPASAPGTPSTKQAGKPATAAVDHFLAQSLALQSGRLRAHADIQDIGKGFNGFQALRASNANDKALLDQLTQMEGEKGIRRLGFGLALGTDPKSQTLNGLALDWSRIQDGKGTIQQETLGYTSRQFHANYAAQDIGSGFTQFSGLREADKTQWAHQKGMHLSSLVLGFNFGSGKKGAPGALDFAEQSFGDKTGGLKREAWNLHSGAFGFQMFRRSTDLAFKRLNDLSDTDKTSLALDLYKQYDPHATAAQVTAADKAQVAREAGLSRDGLRTDIGIGKTGGLTVSEMRVAEAPAGTGAAAAAKPGLQRDNVTLSTGAFDLDYLRTSGDNAFTRIADLADVDKNYLALGIRREFDPDAKLAQITPKERDLAVKSLGFARSNLLARFHLNKSSALTLDTLGIRDIAGNKGATGNEGIRRQTLTYIGKTLQFSLLDQSISDSFTRFSSLTDLERAQFGAEHGLQRQQLGLTWQINKTTKFGFNSLHIGGANDAVTDAVAAAARANQDTRAAALGAQAGLQRDSLSLETKGLTLTAHLADTDKQFTRGTDVVLPDMDKSPIDPQRGYKRLDYTAHIALIKWLTLDSSLFNAIDSPDKLEHNTSKQSLLLTPSKGTKLSYEADSDIATTDAKANGGTHSLLTLNQDFGHGYLLNLFADKTATYANSQETKATNTDSLHFETPKTAPNGASFDTKRVTFQDDSYENTSNLNIHVKPVPQFSFAYTRQEIDRGDANNGETSDAAKQEAQKTPPSVSTDSFDLQWQATKQFSVIAGVSQTDSTDKKNADTVSLGLQGQPVKTVTVAAKFNEAHNDGVNTKDVADVSICNAKPFRLGPIEDLVITARYASLNDQRKLQNETMTGRAAWKIWKNEFLLDYGGLTNPNGTSTISRLYSFKTDPNPKKWFHGSFLYKVRTLVDGEDKLIRRFTADMRLAKATNFVYTYGTLPEDDKGNITPLTTADIAFKHAFRSDFTLQCYYRLSDNQLTKVATSALGFGIDSKLSRTSKLSLAYSKDTNGLAGKFDHCDHLHLSFDQQLNADHFLTLSAEIRSHDSKQFQDEIQTNLDFHTRF